MIIGTGRVKHAYLFVAATIPLDQRAAQRLFPLAWQQLGKTDPNFKRLFDQVERRDGVLTMGAAKILNLANFTDTFQTWLGTRGVNCGDVESLLNKQVFFFSSEERNPRGGNMYKWSVGVYFDIEIKR
jgi:hypothetical protein